MIRMENVSFHYIDSEEGVSGISLNVRNGECVVLTGPSGGGKTTIMRLLNGLAPSYYPGALTGRIFLNKTPLPQLPLYAVGQQVGSVFQDPRSQFFSSELAGEVAFACENYGLLKDEIRSRTDYAIDALSLDHLRERNLDVLSSGEKQRTAIASVYALRPNIYICDEPTSNLDYEGAEELAVILRRLKAEGCTLVIAEHRLSWLHGIADRFVYVCDGRIRWERNADEMERLSDKQRKEAGLRVVREGETAGVYKGDVLVLREVNETKSDPPAPCSPAAALRVQNLYCRKKGREIFRNISFTAYTGQITAITGRNGAGKTSLALVLSGLWRESGGQIEIGGKKRRAGQRRRQIWFSSNDTGTQFFTNSVTEELLLHSERSEERLERTRELLNDLGLYAYKDAHPTTLSGGQKQRLSIACGVLSDRKILIFDEPTSGLDGGSMNQIADVLRSEAKAGKTILVITHDQELVRCCCDYEMVVFAGQ
ncbi:energy-coupling factor ABC transporter ATP-binding protein [Lacrimispora sp. NSJ-141]|uniref:Energy-coupling factor ABC transporter ATP-binding protein n=1 Tax=Lientehia hominis TaxID=2897778 RepID=A0AAP2RG44_9FIRM|nr:energy-coupling factor ABC transporter ATP-binding protein [Lientehia hominis]MCD2491582.1 energy-coupling factor ABC transporter ATP-binding protein [Lientehia hominis]